MGTCSGNLELYEGQRHISIHIVEPSHGILIIQNSPQFFVHQGDRDIEEIDISSFSLMEVKIYFKRMVSVSIDLKLNITSSITLKIPPKFQGYHTVRSGVCFIITLVIKVK